MIGIAPVTAVTSRRRIWVTRIFCVGIVALFLLSRSVWHDWGSTLPHVLWPLGLMLATVGTLGRIWCSSYAAGNKNALLVTAGPYSLTRNPLYFFSLIGGLGIAMTTETLAIPLIFTAWFAWYYRAVVGGEEGYLRSAFGQQYDDYVTRVPRFFPRWNGFDEPDRWRISPRSFRRSLTEVGWFVIAAVLLHAIHDLRSALGDPSLFPLP